MVNAMGPYNLKPEDLAEKIRRIDDIGGPDTHSNFPHGWAMAANTPLKRYKQNTHGGGIRDPLVMAWPQGIAARGELRHGFRHASDLAPTLLELCGVAAPASINGVAQMPITGQSFRASLANAEAPARSVPQYFEMFGHRGIWHDGWKAVAFHPLGTPFENDVWELYHLDGDFAENYDRAATEPQQVERLKALWWQLAEANQVLPMDDRFGARLAENARRYHSQRRQFVFHAGMGHLPTDVAPDVRARDYLIEADVLIPAGSEGVAHEGVARTGVACEGVLLAHGDATSGYSLYVQGGHLVHDLNIGGVHQLIRSTEPVSAGRHKLGFEMTVGPMMLTPPLPHLGRLMVPSSRLGTLLIDGQEAGSAAIKFGFNSMISWSGLDIGRDRGSPVSHYAAPFEFTGKLFSVTVTLQAQKGLPDQAVAQAELARQ